MNASAITSEQVVRLLAAKHKNDVFVPECKFGPTQLVSNVSGRFDAWVMPRSWSRWTTIGYEIKVSRRDFLADQKWDKYLEHCHEFSFVAPPGVIQAGELPDGIGLIETSKNGARLFTRRVAARRDVDAWGPMVYVLMSRCLIGREWDEHRGVEFWRGWLKLRDDDREVGRAVAARMGAQLHAKSCELDRREDIVRAAERRLTSTLESLGIDSEGKNPAQMLQELTNRTAMVEAMHRHAGWIVEAVDRLNEMLSKMGRGEEPE